VVKGPAYGKAVAVARGAGDGGAWPTYRHDPRRSGATKTTVSATVRLKWRAAPGGRLTAPVIADGSVFVASTDGHAVHCLDSASGKARWSRRTDGGIDTPPTLCNGLALVGCRDGWVYAFRATDGATAWRLRAAPTERTVVDDGQLESAWPVHGSVLAMGGLVYFAAGRSSFIDGGIHLYAVRPDTGEVVHRTRAAEPGTDVTKSDGQPYWADGSEAYVLVTDSEDRNIYMAQDVFDPALRKVRAPITSNTGLREMGLHLAPMSDFTDDTWFHRTAWRYCRSWPGVPYAPEGPKSGQILVFNDSTTFALRAFSKQRGHNPLFTAAEGGYTLCADDNGNEAVKPKGYRIHRARPPKWSVKVPVRAVAMVLAGDTLFLAGPPNVFPQGDPYAALEGRKGATLWAVSASDGGKLSERSLEKMPVFDGMAAAEGKLFIATEGGEVICLGP
jgi:outer membrane protein assembly factor BamB